MQINSYKGVTEETFMLTVSRDTRTVPVFSHVHLRHSSLPVQRRFLCPGSPAGLGGRPGINALWSVLPAGKFDAAA